MTMDGSPAEARSRTPLRVPRFLARSVCVVYALALTAGLLMPHAGHVTALAGGTFAEHPRLAHFLAFALLAVLACLGRWPWSRWVMIATLAGYAVTTEAGQAFSPGRTADPRDALANLLGLALGGAIWIVAKKVGR
jgi:VanZ like family